MDMEHALPSGRTVQHGQHDAGCVQSLLDRLGHHLRRGPIIALAPSADRSRNIFGRFPGDHQHMAFGLGHHIHESQSLFILEDFDARNFAAQDFREHIVVVVSHSTILPERAVPGQFADMLAHRRPLRRQELVHPPAQALMRDVMGAVGFLRHVAAQQFMLPLRARFHFRQTMRDGEIYCLIIAGLEMQKGDIIQRPPVAAKSVPSPIRLSAPAICSRPRRAMISTI